MNVFAEIKGVSSAKGAVKRALNYVKNAAKLPAFLGADITDEIAELALSLGYNTKQFEKPLIKAIRILSIPRELVIQEMELQVQKEVRKHTEALTSDQTQLISDVETAGEEKLETLKGALDILKEDFKAMLRMHSWSEKQFRSRLEKAGVTIAEFEPTEAVS